MESPKDIFLFLVFQVCLKGKYSTVQYKGMGVLVPEELGLESQLCYLDILAMLSHNFLFLFYFTLFFIVLRTLNVRSILLLDF